MRMERDQIADMLALGMDYEQYDAFEKLLTSQGKTINDHFRERDKAMQREIEDLKQYANSLKQTIEEMRERGCKYGEVE